MPLEFKLTGIDQMVRSLDRLSGDLSQSAQSALHNEAERTFLISQSRVPVQTGDLRNSGEVSDPVVSREGVEVTIKYGNDRVNYAAAVHESPDSTNRKFLEDPLRQSTGGFLSRVGSDIQKDIK